MSATTWRRCWRTSRRGRRSALGNLEDGRGDQREFQTLCNPDRHVREGCGNERRVSLFGRISAQHDFDGSRIHCMRMENCGAQFDRTRIRRQAVCFDVGQRARFSTNACIRSLNSLVEEHMSWLRFSIAIAASSEGASMLRLRPSLVMRSPIEEVANISSI